MTHQAGEIGVAEHPAWFTDEELDGFKDVERVGEDVIEVLCSCKSSRCGHYLGKLRVFRDGRLCVHCQCTPHCDLVDATPRQFVSHARARGGPGQWPSLIWVHDRQEGMKRINKTLLMRYFTMAMMRAEKKHKDKFHKDEFMTCSKCGVERRFKLSNALRCRAYHDATLAEKSWTCSMHPFRKIDCNTKAERATRKLVRGCRNGTCGGCHLCSCTGCHMCRYQDCGCKICIDYTRNS
uniref:Uncharacterized protein n=1 Tax=Kalanchoe fedtschenkoi TaxID=63787 RepID=A0A7N0VNM4_KALFE